jgi:nucleoid-associated protein YgaU
MGRDKVLGLSLAILLIGFAGAFCFRNEELVEKGLKLAREKILDEGIAKRPGPKPYVADAKSETTPRVRPAVTLEGIQAIETERPRAAERPRPRSDRSISISTDLGSPIDTDSPTPPIEQFASERRERSAPEPVSKSPMLANDLADTPTAIVDKPLELTIRPNAPSSSAFDSPDSLLDDSTTWQHPADCRDGCPAMVGRERESSDAGRAVDSTTASASTTYIVRRGDTLMRIAQHFLGDGNRYREIFETNRDQLQSPNARLKVGMTLQIPGERPRSKRAANSPVSPSRSARPSSSTAGSPRAQQVPARPVSRTRELSKSRPREDASAGQSGDDAQPQESTGTPRFVPVTKGPFWRSGDSSSIRPGSRDLSQRPPSAQRRKSAADRETDSKSDGNSSDAPRSTNSRKTDSDGSTMGSDEGM